MVIVIDQILVLTRHDFDANHLLEGPLHIVDLVATGSVVRARQGPMSEGKAMANIEQSERIAHAKLSMALASGFAVARRHKHSREYHE